MVGCVKHIQPFFYSNFQMLTMKESENSHQSPAKFTENSITQRLPLLLSKQWIFAIYLFYETSTNASDTYLLNFIHNFHFL